MRCPLSGTHATCHFTSAVYPVGNGVDASLSLFRYANIRMPKQIKPAKGHELHDQVATRNPKRVLDREISLIRFSSTAINKTSTARKLVLFFFIFYFIVTNSFRTPLETIEWLSWFS